MPQVQYSTLQNNALIHYVLPTLWHSTYVQIHLHNPSGRNMSLGSTQPLTEMSTRNVYCGVRRPVRRADNLTTFMCQLSCNLGASTSWNPQGLSRPVMGLLYLYLLPTYRGKYVSNWIILYLAYFLTMTTVTVSYLQLLEYRGIWL